MRYDYTYDVHEAVDAHRLRHRERHLSHRRALTASGQSSGIVSRMIARLGGMRSTVSRPSAIAYETQVLTDKVCRLADGSRGRIAIRESAGARIEICVPNHASR